MSIATRILRGVLLSCAAVSSTAQDKPAPPPIQREIIPGSELMTSRERERYRSRMRERARLRALDLAGERGKAAP